ncbi:MAG TPA: PIN domain nuclease [Terriglobales bacterium]|nr:PIN domain nuclease [Terriglobales bacterium]
MVIVDSTVWIDYLRGSHNAHTDWLDSHFPSRRFALLDLILGEVLQGFADQTAFSEVRNGLLQFHIFPTGGVDLAVAAAENFRTLRQTGYTVRKTIDCLIATYCLQNSHALLHRDRDFDPFEEVLGLQVIRV